MKKNKILVIDDEKVVCLGFERVLSEAGYEVESALSGEEALKKVKSTKYDLIFIDLILPGLDGIETCKRINKLSSDSVCVFMTGKIVAGLTYKELQFEDAGGKNFFLYKPFAEEEILDVAKKVLVEKKS